MANREAFEMFSALTEEQQKDVINYMKLPKFWRSEQMFREKFWWFPLLLSVLSLILSIVVEAG